MVAVDAPQDASVSARGKALPDAIHQKGVVGAGVTVGHDVVGRGVFQVITGIVEYVHSFVKHIKGVLVGKSMLAASVGAGTEGKREVAVGVQQVGVHHRLACVFIPYHLVHVLRLLCIVCTEVHHAVHPQQEVLMQLCGTLSGVPAA